ncbi:hypothetical protein AX289_22285 [Methylorubrum populi]|nr:hypothetical protein AX289_22285 [Methylorubrum populi]
MTIRLVLPAAGDLAASCLTVAGARDFPRHSHQTAWIVPTDQELARRRYPVEDEVSRIRSAGAFQDADCLFGHAPTGEADVFWPCPWGAGADEESLPSVAGALALLLRDHAPGVGAVAISEGFSEPNAFGFVTYGLLETASARAAALCTAYVAAGELPPAQLALQAAEAGRLPDDMPEDVRSAVRASLEDLATRVGAAVENAAETGFRPSP